MDLKFDGKYGIKVSKYVLLESMPEVKRALNYSLSQPMGLNTKWNLLDDAHKQEDF